MGAFSSLYFFIPQYICKIVTTEIFFWEKLILVYFIEVNIKIKNFQTFFSIDFFQCEKGYQ